jgi:hypothetical protein
MSLCIEFQIYLDRGFVRFRSGFWPLERKKSGCSNRKKRIRSKTTPAPLLSARTAANDSKFFVKREAKVNSPGRRRTNRRKAREIPRSLPERILFREIEDVLRR